MVKFKLISKRSVDSATSRGLEFKLRRLLEKFRSRMPNGIPDLGIPPLEPLIIDEAFFGTHNPEFGKYADTKYK